MSRADHILMVTPNFPPFARAGSARTGALARYWAGQGRQVSVLAAATPGSHGIHKPLNMPGVTPEFLSMDSDDGAPADHPAPAPAKPAARRTSEPGPLRRMLWDMQSMPDRYNPHWVERAAESGIEKVRNAASGEAPTLVYSSGPPNSAHIVAAKIKAATGLPWISEQRDVWINNPYDSRHWLAKIFSHRLARRTLPTADAFVGVTRSSVAELQQSFDAPVLLAYNGLDPDDFVSGADGAPAPYHRERLTIIHAGVIYAGRRDPRALFAAIALLTPEQAAKIRVVFFHDEYDYATRLAEEHGVMGSVEFRALVPREEILALERQVDVLLVCRSHDAKGAGIIPGKLFEYIGARRPILALGSEEGEAVEIIRNGHFGLVSNDPQVIADQLVDWLAQKEAHGGRIPDLPEEPTHAFERSRQFEKVDSLIDQLLERAA